MSIPFGPGCVRGAPRTACFIVAAALVAGSCTGDADGPAAPSPEAPRATDINGGGSYACAIVADATIRCTGVLAGLSPSIGQWQQLGPGGAEHACGIRANGIVGCWGINTNDKLRGPGGPDFREAVAGTQHSCAVAGDGAISCWGLNDRGQTDAPEGTGFHAISASRGGDHTCALAADGAIVCWGADDAPTPPAGSDYRQLALTGNGGCALTFGGTIHCWGDAIEGVPATAGFSAISAGRDFLCALRDQSIECWRAAGSAFPLAPPAGEEFVRVAAGHNHACAMRRNGSVTCWGSIDDFPGVAK